MLARSQEGDLIPERRVLLVDTTRMFGELIRELVRDKPEVTLVGEVHQPVDLNAVMCETGANCVIVAAPDGRLPPDCQDLMDGYAAVKLVLLIEEGCDGAVWHLEPRRVPSEGAVTREDLLSAIGVA
jgi:hypothetical protein